LPAFGEISGLNGVQGCPTDRRTACPESISPIRVLIRVLRISAFLVPLLVTVAAAQEPSILQLGVVEGEGAVYPLGSRATRGITVQVTDDANRPVEGATVSFLLPASGAGGAFANGSRTEIATTGGDGRASVWGMQWNRTAGSFEIRITAAKGPTRAGTLATQYLSGELAPHEANSLKSRMGPGHGHKWLWIAVAVAGAAAGGVAVVLLKDKSSTTTTASTGLQISPPTINLGRP
jgi:hypothetical protein